MRAFVILLLAIVPLSLLASDTVSGAGDSSADTPWLWILIAFGLALGVLLAWVSWARRLPPPGEPWG